MLSVLSVGYSSLANAHGYTDFPKARQQFCADDGGYWWPDDGSAIPNLGCRAAFLKSGTFQFVQSIEFSKNVADYENIAAVKAAIPDGSLCASGDSAKRGIDVPSPHWQRTDIQLDANGEFEFLFYAATPHNPSFWEFYLTKPSYDASQPLKWSDLELVDSHANVSVTKVGGRNMYKMQVSLPVDRDGDAILYTRWQRRDPAGEGFYNCSDITIKNVTTPPDEWNDKGFYVQKGDEANIGDEIWFRVFTPQGNEKVFEKLKITESNQSIEAWSEELANSVNQKHANAVKLGVKDAQQQVVYDARDPYANKVWLTSSQESYALDIKKQQTNLPPDVSLESSYRVDASGKINISVKASDPDNDPLSYAWTVPSELSASNTDSATVSISANKPSQTTSYSVSVAVSDGTHTVKADTQLTVVVGNDCVQTDPNADQYPTWDSSATYVKANQVNFEQLVWRANWWNQGSQPSISNTTWTLVSDVELGWQAGKSYQSGDEVDHKSRRWSAKWWTQSEPGPSSDWKDIGPAKCL